jgi:hypothetical protein
MPLPRTASHLLALSAGILAGAITMALFTDVICIALFKPAEDTRIESRAPTQAKQLGPDRMTLERRLEQCELEKGAGRGHLMDCREQLRVCEEESTPGPLDSCKDELESVLVKLNRLAGKYASCQDHIKTNCD